MMEELGPYVSAYFSNPKTAFYNRFVKRTSKKPSAEKVLKRFVDSRLDINRLKAAAQFIDESLFPVITWRELGVLRKAVTEREVRRAMRYERYRDHTCHTLWGFLLGCLWFERSEKIRELAGPLTDAKCVEPNEEALQSFAAVWTLGFLCHDIGYLFESDIPAGLTPNPLTDLQSACALLNDCYQSIYVSKFVGTSNVKYVRELRELGYPMYAGNSLAVVAENLRQLPLADRVLTDADGEMFLVPNDVFELFKREGCKEVNSVERAFRFLYETGKYGQKFLDHGICSGLLMAQLLILGYGLYMIGRLPPSTTRTRLDADFLARLKKGTDEGSKLTVQMIHTRVKWIFGASRHNLDRKWWSEAPQIPEHKPKKLAADRDFPSYLITLMDTIQDWDRPRMNSNTKADDFVMDSTDLLIALDRNRIHLRGKSAPAKGQLKKLEDDLDERLMDWSYFVVLD